MYASPNHARVMLWCGVAMCLAAITAIAAAELFMPDNYHGKKGVITFYRCFGPWLIAWGRRGVGRPAGAKVQPCSVTRQVIVTRINV